MKAAGPAFPGLWHCRNLKKTQHLSQSIYPLIQELEGEVKTQVIHSLVIFCWCFYCSKDNENIPTLEYVTGRGYKSLGIGKKVEKTESEKAWDGILQHYNYYVTDEFDLEIKCQDQTNFKSLLQ